MYRIIFISAILLILASCEDGGTHDYDTNFGQNNESPIDRIPERNNPKSLDLSEQLLFIDTTGEGQFYWAHREWEESAQDLRQIAKKLEEIDEGFDLQQIDLNDFPSDWIIIYQYKGAKILANLEAGQKGRRYRITNESVTFYNQGLTQRVHGIKALNELTPERISLDLIVEDKVSKDRMADFKIQPTNEDYIYLLTCIYDNHTIKSLVTPLSEIHHFEMLVRHNEGLVWNPVNMDRIDFDQIEADLMNE